MIDVSSPSSFVSNADENRDLHKRMFGLKESIKLIIAALKIREVESRDITKENIARVESTKTAMVDSAD